jgi:hypothetical protein
VQSEAVDRRVLVGVLFLEQCFVRRDCSYTVFYEERPSIQE